MNNKIELLEELDLLDKLENHRNSLTREIDTIKNKKTCFETTGAEFLTELEKVVKKDKNSFKLVEIDTEYACYDGNLVTIQGVQNKVNESNNGLACFRLQVILNSKSLGDNWNDNICIKYPFDISMKLTNGKELREYLDTKQGYDDVSGCNYTEIVINQDCIKYLPIKITKETIRINCTDRCQKLLRQTIENIYEKRLKQESEEKTM